MKSVTPKEQFWVTNVSNRNVSLTDLNLTIQPYSSVNLLDNKHHSYTKEQVLKSVATGSIFNKRDKILVRNAPPIKSNKPKLIVAQDIHMPSKSTSIYQIKESSFEELNVDNTSDEAYAAENADLIEMDNTIKRG